MACSGCRAFAGAEPGDVDALGVELGALMYESHASYSACGLGSSGTDDLVALARDAGPARGVFGAKITGGGSGGTVALLTRADAGSVVEEIATRYAGAQRPRDLRVQRIVAGRGGVRDTASINRRWAIGRRLWPDSACHGVVQCAPEAGSGWCPPSGRFQVVPAVRQTR